MANQALTEAVYYILLSLLKPMHGYGIMQNVERMTDGRLKLAAGTLYGAVSGLLKKGWIVAVPGEKEGRKKEYVITPQGIEALYAEVFRLQELTANGIRVLQEAGETAIQ